MKVTFYASAGVEFLSVELDPGSVVDRKATDADRERFSTEYREFKAPPSSVSSTPALPVAAASSTGPEEPPLPPEPPEEKPRGFFSPKKKK